jgi:hypothetical protein
MSCNDTPVILSRPLTTASSVMCAGGFGNKKPFKTKLVSSQFSITSSTNTALNVNQQIAMTTSNFPDLTSFQLLFDEIRVLKGQLHYHFDVSTAATNSGTPSAAALGLVFDDSQPAPTSLSQVLILTNHTPPLVINPIGSATSFNGLPYQKLNFQQPKIAVLPATTVSPVGNNWFSTDPVSTNIVVDVLAYCDGIGASGVTKLTFWLVLDVEFKMRV